MWYLNNFLKVIFVFNGSEDHLHYVLYKHKCSQKCMNLDTESALLFPADCQ